MATWEANPLLVAVWLTENADSTKDYLPKVEQSLQFQATTLGFFADDPSGPKDWGIHPEAGLTVVAVHRQKIIASLGYRSVNENDVKTLLKYLRPSPQDQR